ncbi:tandem-95 repeat protein [Candidatus Cloacimonadota bacterium]
MLQRSEVEADVIMADNFWGLSGSPIGGIRFWGASWEDDAEIPHEHCESENPMEFEFTFYTDNAGAIGEIVTQFNASPSMTPADLGTASLYEFECIFPNPVILDEGWISIQGQTADPNCWFWWINSVDGDSTSYADFGATRAWGSYGYDWSMSLFEEVPIEPDPLAGSGKCLEFDGVNEYVDAGVIDLSDSVLTIEAWIKADSFQTAWPYISSIAGEETDDPFNTAVLRLGDATLANNKLQFVLQTGPGNPDESKLNGNTSLNAGEWYHVAATYDGSNMRLFVNGIEDAVMAQTGLFTADTTFWIGRSFDGRYFNGQIDEVRVWNTARTEDDIRNSMCSKLVGDESGLVGYWRFDESTGSFCWDDSGNENHGSLINMDIPDDHVWSGAALGDVSYPNYYIPIRGAEDVVSSEITQDRYGFWGSEFYWISSQASGLQYYEIFEPPNSTDMYGYLDTLGTSYFGFFMCGGGLKYDFGYSYNGYPNIGAESTYDLARRANNAEMMWDQTYAIQIMEQDRLHLYGETGTEYILGASEYLHYTCEDTIAYDTEWSGIDTVYVWCDVFIADSLTLDIEEGTYVQFMPYIPLRAQAPGIFCEGSIIAEGTETDPIFFSVFEPEFNDWYGIYLINESLDYYLRSTSSFQFCDISNVYADSYEYFPGGAITAIGYSQVNISDCNIHDNFGILGGGVSSFMNSGLYMENNKVHHNYSLIGGGIAVEDTTETQEIPIREWSTTTITGNEIYNNVALLSGGGIHIMDLYMFMNHLMGYGGRAEPEDYQYQILDNDIHDNYAVSLYYILEYFLDVGREGSDFNVKSVFEQAGLDYTNKIHTFVNNLDELPDEITNSRYFTNLLAFGGGGVFASYVDVNLDGNTIENNATMAYLDDIFMDPPFSYFDGPYDVQRIALGCGAGVLLRGLAEDYTYYGPGPGRSLPPYRPFLNDNDIIDNKIEIMFEGMLRNGSGDRIFENSVYATALGAGVFSLDTRPTLTDNLISGNEIGLIDSTTILNDLFLVRNDGDRNSNYAPPFGYGGGVCQIAATFDTTAFVIVDSMMTINPGFVMTRNEVTNNKAFFGGGIATLGMNFSELVDNTIEYNETFPEYFDLDFVPGRDSLEYFFGIGGGIYDEGFMNISGGSISHNTATMGGGICNSFYSGPGDEGIIRFMPSPLIIDGCDIESNLASGIFSEEYYFMFGDSSYYAAAGGGVLIKSFDFEPVAWYLFEDYWNWLDRNRETNRLMDEIVITNCNINSNKANRIGGGVHVAKDVYGMNLLVDECNFNGNTAGKGGALSYSRFSGPRPLNRQDGSVQVTNSTFINNEADYSGGAVLIDGALFTLIEDCLFEGNEAYSEFEYFSGRYIDKEGYGGAVYLEDLENAALINNEFSLNRAYKGGAIAIDHFQSGYLFPDRDSTFYEGINLINNLIFNNTADSLGGGIYSKYFYSTGLLREPVFTNIYNNTIADNNAYYGGGICIVDETVFGIIQRVASNTHFLNSILWGNYAEGDIYGSQIEVYEYQDGFFGPPSRDLDEIIQIDYCDIQGGYEYIYYDSTYIGPQNRYYSIIDRDPEFRNPNNGNYQLQDISPCINVGHPDTAFFVHTEYDLAGRPRIHNGTIKRIDLGAYEYPRDVILESDVVYLEDIIENDLELCCDTVYVIGDVFIPDSVTVDICPGTTVKFMRPDDIDDGGIEFFRDSYSYAINVYGTLNAIGLPDSMITFTAEDTAYGWGGIRIWGGEADSSNFVYCLFEYAKKFGGPGRDDDITISALDLEGTNDEIRAPGVDGGALHLNHTSPFIDNCEFLNNTARDGGAIYMTTGSSPYISNSYFHDNTAQRYGGAVMVSSSNPGPYFRCRPYFFNNIISENTAYVHGPFFPPFLRYGSGGAVYVEGYSGVSFEYNEILNNEVIQGFGWPRSDEDMKLQGQELDRQNGVWGDGGGILVSQYSRLTMVNNNISHNSCFNDGGGVAVHHDAVFNSIDDLFSHNEAGDYGGAIAAFNRTTIRVHNNTITENTAYIAGGIYPSSPMGPNMIIRLSNTIIWNNYFTAPLREITDEESDAPNNSNFTFTHCIVGNTQYLNPERYIGIIIGLDPKFADPENEDYSLAPNSPAINTGTDALPWVELLPIPEFDLAHNPRIYDGYMPIIDIGCYEFQGDPDVQYIFEGFDDDTYLCADSIYVYCDPYIPGDVSVVICPGTVVNHMDPDVVYDDRYSFDGFLWIIEGCLFAVGTETERITFTAEYPIDPAWNGLYFINGDNDFFTSRLKYCDIEYVNNWDNDEIPYINFYLSYFEWLEDLVSTGAAVNLLDYSNIRISETEFRYNLGVLGGGIGVQKNSFPYIQDNLFHENFALGGGGIFWSPNLFGNLNSGDNRPIVVDSTFKVMNNTFNDNWAVSGGAIYLQQHLDDFYDELRHDTGMEVEVGGNVLNNNISIGNLYLEDVFPMLDSLGVYNMVDLPFYYYENRGFLDEIGNEMFARYSQEYLGNGSRFQIWSGGGGIFSGNLSSIIHDNELTGNGALAIYDEGHYGHWGNYYASRGGGIFTGLDPIYYHYGEYFDNYGIPNTIINNNLIQDNFTFSKSDGIYQFEVDNDEELYVSMGSGAGVYNSYQYLELTENTIVNNNIMIEELDFRSLIQSQNESRSFTFGFAGGGVYHLEPVGEYFDRDSLATTLIQSNIIEGNSALYGGGIAVDRPGEPEFDRETIPEFVIKINNNLVANNSANWDWDLISDPVYDFVVPPGGGGLFIGPYLDCVLINNTVADNQAFAGGGLLNTYNYTLALDNIFWGNEENWGEGQQYPNQISLWGSLIEFYYNDIQDGVDGFDDRDAVSDRDWFEDNFNIDAYPEFALTGEHPYMLVDNSPCANAGDPAITMANLADWYLPEVDLKGADRIYEEEIIRDGIIDIGAYETGNNPPYDIILSEPASVPENEAPGYFVGLLSTLDLDEFDTHTYTLVEDDTTFVRNDNDCFEIRGDSLFTTCTFNFEDLLAPIRGNGPQISSTSSSNRKGDIEFNSGSNNTRPSLPNAWINEFHYDNAGTDVGEFVEIVIDNNYRVDLSGFELVLYNGSNGTVYNILSGSTLLSGASYAEYSFYEWDFPTNGIQNGAPDGLCLAYYGNVIQFLSYEGSSSGFTAVGGPANGMTSTNIGVSETSSTPVGYSLQLTDPGRTSYYGDYEWIIMPETPGAVNTGQTLDIPPPEIGVYVRIRSTDSGEYNMYYEESIFIPVIDMNDDPLIELPDEFEFDEDGELPVDFDQFIADEDVDAAGVRVPNNLTLEVSGNTNVLVDIQGLDVTFTAVEDWFGQETLTFTVYDGWARAQASDDVLVIVEPVDDPPEIEIPPEDSLLFRADEDVPLIVDFEPYLSQAWGETDPLEISVEIMSSSRPLWVMDPPTFTIDGFVVTFTPEPHQYGSSLVRVTVVDGTALRKERSKSISMSAESNNIRNRSNIDDFMIYFLPVNDPPIFEIPIALEAMEDDPSEIYNFLLPPFVVDQTWGEMDSLSLSAVGSTHIDVILDGFNVVIQSNTLDWSGIEPLTFTLSDNVARLETVVVVDGIIHGYNDAPVLGFIDDVVMDEDTTHDITATATDVDNIPADLTFSAYVQDGNLSVSVVDDVVTIIPDPDWYGFGSIVVKVFDGMWYDQQLVLVEVVNVNDPPALDLPESFTFLEGGELVVDMFPYITDADDLSSRLDDYTIELVGIPTDIDVSIEGVVVTFGTLAEDWSGTETLTFVVNDNVTRGRNTLSMNANSRAISPEETVDIIVTNVNDAPYVENPIADFSFPEDTEDNSIDLNTVFDDVDIPYGDILTFSFDVGFYTGMSIDIAAGVVTLTPDPDWNGIFGITFIATDTGGLTASDYVEVTVTPVNDDPVFDLPDELTFHEDGVLVTNFLQYVSDVDGDDLTLTIGETTNIAIEQSFWALIFSTVEENWSGEELITFTVSDGVTRASASDTVNVIVIPHNDPPFYVGTELVTVAEDFGTYTIGDLDDMFDDVEDDALTFTLDFYNPAMLMAEIDGDNNLIITSVDDACGNTSVVVVASDGEYVVQEAISVLIEAVNDPPQLVNLPEHIEMGAYSNMILNLDDCWLDVDDIPTMTIMPADNFIEVTQLPGYDYRFRLDALHVSGMEDIITVVLFDGFTQVTADILVTVADSEAPIITFLIPNLTYNEDFALTEVVDLDQCFEDPEGMPLTFGAFEVDGMGYLDVVVDEDNILSIGSGLTDWNGSVCVDVWANDSSTRTVTTQTVTIEVMPVNDAPYIIGAIDDVVLAEDFGSYVVADLTTIFADVDNDFLNYGVGNVPRDVVAAGIVGTDLMLYSLDNIWGEIELRVWADDGMNSRAVIWIDFTVTVTPVYDNPTFDPNLDGMVFPVVVEGDIIDFSPWIETYGQENSTQMVASLVGQIPYYTIEYVDGAIYSLFAYTIGHQWAFPDQECTLWLDGGSHVTIVLHTQLPDPPPPLSGGTLLLESGEVVRIDLRDEFDSADNFLMLNAHSKLSSLSDDELIVGAEVTERVEEDVTISMVKDGIIQQLTYNVIIEPRSEDTPQFITELRGNHPNPFNPETNIEFSMGETGRAAITIYNIKGEAVRTITDEVYEPGIYNVSWNGKDDSGNSVSSGIYFYKLEAGGTSKIKKMMLLQ